MKKLFFLFSFFFLTGFTCDPIAISQLTSDFQEQFAEDYLLPELEKNCVKKYERQYRQEKQEAVYYAEKAMKTKDYGRRSSYHFLQARHTAQAANRAKAIVECYQEIANIDPDHPAAYIGIENWGMVAQIEERTSNELAIAAGQLDRISKTTLEE